MGFFSRCFLSINTLCVCKNLCWEGGFKPEPMYQKKPFRWYAPTSYYLDTLFAQPGLIWISLSDYLSFRCTVWFFFTWISFLFHSFLLSSSILRFYIFFRESRFLSFSVLSPSLSLASRLSFYHELFNSFLHYSTDLCFTVYLFSFLVV